MRVSEPQRTNDVDGSHELVRTNTTRVKIDDQLDISAAVSDSIVKREANNMQGTYGDTLQRDLDPENSTPAKRDD